MTNLASWQQETPQARLPAWRRVLGIVVSVAVVALAAAFVLGVWNPWRLVVLYERFANPWFGLVVVCVGLYLALWLLMPVRNEALQRGRIAARVAIAGLAVLGLLAWGIMGLFYRYHSVELDRSPDGERAVVLVVSGGLQERELRIYEGAGLLTREAGSMGRACGRVSAWFVDRDTVMVDQGYGEWRFDLDPQTGEPQQVLGPRCPIGPVPATLGR